MDLCSLCRTCKALKAIVLPRIYSCVELYVPLQWNECQKLENLVSLSGDGLKSTKSVIVRIAERTWEEVASIEYADSAWPDILNSLIRVLIRKIPTGALEEFMYVLSYFS